MAHQSPKPSVWARLPALHYHDYRLMWFGLFVSTIGSQMQLTAVNWHIFELLRGRWQPGEFVWPAEWAVAYPHAAYWWLYGSPRIQEERS